MAKKIVYLLEHSYTDLSEEDDSSDNMKILGIFSSIENIENAIEYYITVNGFKEYPKDFKVTEMEVDKNNYDARDYSLSANISDVNGYMDDSEYADTAYKFSIYLLQHYMEYIEEDGERYSTTMHFGIYSSWENGQNAKKHYFSQPQFANLPNDTLFLDRYVLDQKEWREGFSSIVTETPMKRASLSDKERNIQDGKSINYPTGIGSEFKSLMDYCNHHFED